jgi:thioredoxin reductase (NADPH)
MSQYLIDQIESTENIKVLVNTEVIEVKGDTNLEAITLLHNDTKETETVAATSLFIFIGAQPQTNWLDGVIARDERGYILAGADLKQNKERPRGWHLQRDPFLLETSVPGIFVAGDVRHNSIKRVASSVGEGSIAIMFVHRYLAEVRV